MVLGWGGHVIIVSASVPIWTFGFEVEGLVIICYIWTG